MRAFSFVARYGALLSLCLGTCLTAPHYWRANNPTSVSTVFQLDRNGTWFENIMVQRNGSILATRIDVPELWSINPSNNSSSQGTGFLLYKFPNATSVLGITEMDRGVYAVVAGNVSLPTVVPTPGSFVIWTIDLTGQEPKAKVLTSIPAGQFLDGLTRFSKDILLIADAAEGVIWSLNTTTGDYSQASSHLSMLLADGQPVMVGVNGLKVLNNYVYYTSTSREVYARIPVDQNASATGPVEVITSGFTFDGFVLREDGTTYITTDPQNELLEISLQGKVRLVVGNQFKITVGGSTAITFGNNHSVLYATTSGAQFAPILGETMEPAKIVANKL